MGSSCWTYVNHEQCAFFIVERLLIFFYHTNSLNYYQVHKNHWLQYFNAKMGLLSLQEFHKAFLDAKCSSGDNQEYVFEFLVGQSSPSSQQYRGNIAEIFWVWQKRKVGDTPTRDLQQWQDFDEEGCHGDQSQEVTELVQSSSSSVPPYPGEGFGTPGGLPILKVIFIIMK